MHFKVQVGFLPARSMEGASTNPQAGGVGFAPLHTSTPLHNGGSGGGNGASDGQNYGQINGQMNGGAEYIYGPYHGSSNDAGGGQISGRYFIDQTTGHVVYFQPNGGGQPMAMKMENSAAAATGVTPSGTGYQM